MALYGKSTLINVLLTVFAVSEMFSISGHINLVWILTRKWNAQSHQNKHTLPQSSTSISRQRIVFESEETESAVKNNQQLKSGMRLWNKITESRYKRLSLLVLTLLRSVFLTRWWRKCPKWACMPRYPRRACFDVPVLYRGECTFCPYIWPLCCKTIRNGMCATFANGGNASRSPNSL